ncbi:CBS domain-containing protein [Mucilaginibacter pineti]|uniref:CBS domain-containing protein n=1 Tax=Mucilaginibacter pineti TaxID=1391627 RepID=A0A1G7EPC3_9SPHI|nr:CBS domain-containing protein [Mucilaginibacter pineti]SDE65482.1 CBS domain-containing protein [Mucilaginibacter pineti]
MKIENIIVKNFTTICASEEMHEVAEWLKDQSFLAVADEDSKVIGIITMKDVPYPPFRLVLDSEFIKPHLSPENTVIEAFELMQQSVTDHLPVFENETFVGAVRLIDVGREMIAMLQHPKQPEAELINKLSNALTNMQGLISLLADLDHRKDYREILSRYDQSCREAFSVLHDKR